MVWTFKIDEINEVAKACLKEIGDSRVIAFHGEMGAGKTTFIHALCDVLGVKDVVGSPTFSIINEYLFNDNGRPGKIYHIDLYRVKDEEEAIQAGVEDKRRNTVEKNRGGERLWHAGYRQGWHPLYCRLL